MDEYIGINEIARIKGLKSTRSIRLAINQGKYIAREVEVKGGKSYEILYSSLEPDIQDRLNEEELKTTALIPFENKMNFVSEHAKLTALARGSIDKIEILKDLPESIPSEIIDKRPDILKSEAQLQAAILSSFLLLRGILPEPVV